MLAFSACLKDLDQRPVVESESDATEVYSSVDGFRGVLAKIYASYCIAGQEKGGGNADLSSNNGFDLLRGYFNMQESATDELAGTWLSGDKIEFLTFMNWDASDPWVSDTYYRLYYTISLCNEFLRNTGLADGFSDTDKATVATYAGEARFLRALAYWMVLDLYGKGPYVDETMTVGSYMPEAYDSKQLFDFIESELKAISLPKPSATEYGRASEAAAWTLLARLYLNAGVYGAGDHFSDCIECCKKVLADGFSLESDYGKLFNADNHLRTNEIIFPFVVDSRESVSWGATTYVVCGQISHTDSEMAAAYGVNPGWGSFRVRGELPGMFGDVATTSDSRARFFTTGRTQWFTGPIDNADEGFFSVKWTNLKDDGSTSCDTASGGVDTDYPFFRLADVYLMAAEAVLRGGTGMTRSEALGLVNDLRTRAYGNASGAVADADFNLDLILDERARELYLEGQRRTDLIRFGKFTTSSYIWQWKGGVLDGRAVADKYNLYPIPAAELSANTNLKNENY